MQIREREADSLIHVRGLWFRACLSRSRDARLSPRGRRDDRSPKARGVPVCNPSPLPLSFSYPLLVANGTQSEHPFVRPSTTHYYYCYYLRGLPHTETTRHAHSKKLKKKKCCQFSLQASIWVFSSVFYERMEKLYVGILISYIIF